MRRLKFKKDDGIGMALRRMPLRGASPDFFVRLRNELERESSGRSAPGQVESSGRSRRVAVLAATAVLAALAGALTTATVYAADQDETAGESPVTTFEPTNGWNMVLTTVDPNSPNLPIVWAANVPFASEESTTGFPTNTASSLPPDGIVMTVIGPREYTGDTVFPAAQFPLTIAQGFCSDDQYEGQLAPHVSKCLVDTMVDAELLNVIVWFGTNTPSDAMYVEANAQLARLVVPGQS